MDFFETVKKRISVREYSQKPIEESILAKIVDSARLAPTARCVEPWEFIVVTDKKDLTKLGQMAPNGAFLKDAVAAIVTLSKQTKYYLEDGSAATENMLLAATALGLGSCWVAGDKKDYAPEVCKLFGAPSELKLVSIIALGYPKSKTAPRSKRSLSEVIHKDKF